MKKRLKVVKTVENPMKNFEYWKCLMVVLQSVKVTVFCWPSALCLRTWKCKYPRQRSKLIVVLFYMFFILSFLTGPQRVTEHVTDFFSSQMIYFFSLFFFFFFFLSATHWVPRQHRRNHNSSLLSSSHCKIWSLMDSPGPGSAEFVWRLRKTEQRTNHPSLFWSIPELPLQKCQKLRKSGKRF